MTRSAAGSAPTTWTASPSTAASRCSTPAYPALRGHVDLDRARPAGRSTPPSASTSTASGSRVVNPVQRPERRRCPRSGLPVGGVRRQGRAGAVRRPVRDAAPAGRLKQRRDDLSAAEAWRRANIPPDVVDGMLRPFFSGVLLEQDMSTSRRFTDLMMRMFVRGRSTVPAARHAAAARGRSPRSLACGTACGWQTRVRRRHRPRSSTPTTGAVDARAVVVATDAWTAARLLPVWCSSPGAPRRHHRLPLGAGLPRGLRRCCCWTPPTGPRSRTPSCSPAAAPEYAPAGRALVSTSMVHGSAPCDPDGPEVRAGAGPAARHRRRRRGSSLATYDLPHALPGMPAPHPLRKPVRLTGAGETVYVAGDHRDTSSIQGALVSGRRAAHAVLADLTGSVAGQP